MALTSRHFTWNVVITALLVMTMPAASVLLALSVNRVQASGSKGMLLSFGAIVAAIVAVFALFRLIRIIRYPVNQTELMARAVVAAENRRGFPRKAGQVLLVFSAVSPCCREGEVP